MLGTARPSGAERIPSRRFPSAAGRARGIVYECHAGRSSMKSPRLLDRFDDLLNPIAVKELRQAVKSRIVMSALMLFLLIQLSILLLNLWFDDRRGSEALNLHAGQEIFRILQGFLLGTCMLLVPAYAG